MSNDQAPTILPGNVTDLPGAPAPKGAPSDSLKRFQVAVQRQQQGQEPAGVLDTSGPSYERLTNALPEEGVYKLVGGYLDEEGVLHNEVHVKAMTGHEEDMLGNRKIPFVLRVNGILSNVVQRIGTITDRSAIARAVADMPVGTRQHLLVCVRVTTHWRTEKDIYEFKVECGTCKHEGSYKTSLLDMDRVESQDQTLGNYEVKLPNSGAKMVLRVLPGAWDHALDILMKASRHESLSYGIMARIVSWDEKSFNLGIVEVLTGDGQKVRLHPRAQALLKMVKDLTSGDRDFLRSEFLNHEPGIDTDIECECSNCGAVFTVPLDVTQESFFFPTTTSTRWKRRSST